MYPKKTLKFRLVFVSAIMLMNIPVLSEDTIDSLSVQTRAFLQNLVLDYQLCQEQTPEISSVVRVDAANFEAEVLNSDLPVVIDVYGIWCGPCDIFKTIYAKVAADFAGKVKFVAIDYDSYPEFIKQYHIDSVPHLMFFHKGLCVAQVPGVQLSNDLFAMVERFVQLSEQTNI